MTDETQAEDHEPCCTSCGGKGADLRPGHEEWCTYSLPMTEPDAYRDVDGTVYVSRKHTLLPSDILFSDFDPTATPLWLTEAPDGCLVPCDSDCDATCHAVHQPTFKRVPEAKALDPAVIAAVLAEHAGIEGYFDRDQYRNNACSCGWYSTADNEAAHRDHLAAAVCAALKGDVVILTPEQRKIAGMFCNIEMNGTRLYCYKHYASAKDKVACLDAEDIAEQLLELEKTK